MRRNWIPLAACALIGCENPAGQTDRFVAEANQNIEEARGKVEPVPRYKPREVTPLVIERDPFRR